MSNLPIDTGDEVDGPVATPHSAHATWPPPWMAAFDRDVDWLFAHHGTIARGNAGKWVAVYDLELVDADISLDALKRRLCMSRTARPAVYWLVEAIPGVYTC